jgi:hypothetical protein
MSAALLFFARYPQAGRVKTRLAATLGKEAACEAYRAMAEDSLEGLAASGLPVTVFYDPPGKQEEMRAWLGEAYAYHVQSGPDLGARMARAVEEVLALGADRAVLTGSDCPELGPKLVRAALDALDEAGCALAPSGDGGYTLIGFSRTAFAPEVFRGVEWGGASVLEASLAILKRRGVRTRLLPELRDMDVQADLLELARRRTGGSAAPRTLAFLDAAGLLKAL